MKIDKIDGIETSPDGQIELNNGTITIKAERIRIKDTVQFVEHEKIFSTKNALSASESHILKKK